MGYHKLPSMRHFWARREDLGIRPIQQAMTRDRFITIFSKIHLDDNNKWTTPKKMNCTK